MAVETKEKKKQEPVEAPDPNYNEWVDENAEADIASLLGELGTETEPSSEAPVSGESQREEETDQEEDQDDVEDDAQSEEEVADDDWEPEDSEDEEDGEDDDEEAANVSAEVAALKEMVSVLQAQLQEAQASKSEGERNKPLTVPDENFVDDDSADEIYSVEGQNKFGNLVLKKAVALAREIVMRELPDHVQPMIYSGVDNKLRAEKFYAENPDIAKLDRGYVKGVADKIAKQHPDWDSAKLFAAIPKVIRKELNLKKANRAAAGKKKGPKGPKPGGTRKEAPARTEVEKDIDALMSVTPIT